jgi:hypothetical protein
MRRTRRWCNNWIRCSGSPEKSTPEATRHLIEIARDKNEDANQVDGLGHRTEKPRGFAVSQPLALRRHRGVVSGEKPSPDMGLFDLLVIATRSVAMSAQQP